MSKIDIKGLNFGEVIYELWYNATKEANLYKVYEQRHELMEFFNNKIQGNQMVDMLLERKLKIYVHENREAIESHYYDELGYFENCNGVITNLRARQVVVTPEKKQDEPTVKYYPKGLRELKPIDIKELISKEEEEIKPKQDLLQLPVNNEEVKKIDLKNPKQNLASNENSRSISIDLNNEVGGNKFTETTVSNEIDKAVNNTHLISSVQLKKEREMQAEIELLKKKLNEKNLNEKKTRVRRKVEVISSTEEEEESDSEEDNGVEFKRLRKNMTKRQIVLMQKKLEKPKTNKKRH